MHFYSILHITSGEIFISCNKPEEFIDRSIECLEEYEILDSYYINTANYRYYTKGVLQ